MFFWACSLGHPKTWQFGVLSGLWLRKKGDKDGFLLLARKAIGKVALWSKELCL